MLNAISAAVNWRAFHGASVESTLTALSAFANVAACSVGASSAFAGALWVALMAPRNLKPSWRSTCL